MNPRLPKYFELAQQLESQLADGSFRKGQRLPPIRTLARQNGVCLVTMNRSVRMLADKGLLECRPGGGTVVLRRPAPRQAPVKRGRVGFVLVRNSELPLWEGYRILLEEVQRAPRTTGRRTEFEQIFDGVDAGDLETIREVGWESMIVTGAVTDEAVCALKSLDIPLVVAGSYQLSEPCTQARIDVETSMLGVFHRLLATGHRRIGVARATPRIYVTRVTPEVCERAHREAGVPFDRDLQVEFDDANNEDAAVARLARRMPDMDALFISWNCVPTLRQFGFEQGRNITLAGIRRLDQPADVHLDIELDHSHSAWADAAVRALLKQTQAGPDARPFVVSVPMMQTVQGEFPGRSHTSAADGPCQIVSCHTAE